MIVITTPTGNICSQLLRKVLEAGVPARLIVRDAAKLPASVRERVEIVEGSHGDAQVVDEAFAGADTLFWLVPPNPKATDVHAAYVDFTRPACEAIKRHGVKRVVAVSALGRELPQALQAGLVTASLAMDDLLAATGVDLRVLVMPSFMDNILNQVPLIKAQGMFVSPISGSRKAPTCATRDIAAAAADLLLAASWTGQAEVPVLGPEDLSNDDMAATLSEVLGKPVRFQQVPVDAFRQQLIGFGWSDAMAQGMVDMFVAKENGLDSGVQRTAETGSPTTFKQWCEAVLKPAVAA